MRLKLKLIGQIDKSSFSLILICDFNAMACIVCFKILTPNSTSNFNQAPFFCVETEFEIIIICTLGSYNLQNNIFHFHPFIFNST